MTAPDRFENFNAAWSLSPEQRAVQAMYGDAAVQPLVMSVEIEGTVDAGQLCTAVAGVLHASQAPEGGVVLSELSALDASRHRLTLAAHPLAADGGSLATLFARIADAHRGIPAESTEPFQYTQFAAWREALAQDDGEEDAVQGRAYWASHMPATGDRKSVV